MDTPSTNGREASAASTSQPASMNPNTMKELKAKWQQSVKELNENVALAQALMASPPKVTQVKPKVSASERLPVIKMPEDVPKPRTSLLGSGSIRYMFKAHGGPDPPKPPPSPFEAYAFADFTVPMPKVIQVREISCIFDQHFLHFLVIHTIVSFHSHLYSDMTCRRWNEYHRRVARHQRNGPAARLKCKRSLKIRLCPHPLTMLKAQSLLRHLTLIISLAMGV